MPTPYSREDETEDRFHPSEQGRKFLEEHLKTVYPGNMTGLTHEAPIRRHDSGTNAYDHRHTGGTDFEIGDSFETPYHGIEVKSTGDVTVVTASGEKTTISFSNTDEIKEVSVDELVSSTVAVSDIVLYRY